MAVAIRLARGGSKKRPYYKIIVADARSSRDGKFIERIGSYNPLLSKDDAARVVLDTERAKHWLSVGAQPSDRVLRFLDAAGVMERTARNNPTKGLPGDKAKERVEEQEKKAADAAEAAAEAANAPAPEVVEDAPAAEAPADDSQAETEAVMAAEVEAATEAPTPEAEAIVEAVAAEPTPEAPAETNAATPDSDAGDDTAAVEGESAQKPAEG